MKTADKQRRTTVGACKKNGLDCTKSGTKKTARQRQKATEKNSTEATGQLVPSRNQPSPLQTLVMQTSNQAILPGNSVPMSKQYPQCSGKLKLQLFPIDEVTQKGLEQDKYNPYLELILPTRKKISSVVKHLNVKWGSSKSASGDLMLFPYNAHRNNLVSYRRWTIKESDTRAADVYAAVGSPAIFRLRYGWFSNLAPTTCERPLASLHSEDCLQIKETQIINAIEEKIPQCPASNIENGSACFHNSLNQGIGAPPVLDKSVQDKFALLSWADCLSNISIGTLLSEAQLAQNSSLQQIPITCDSFDAAVASIIAREQTKYQSTQVSHSSIWDAEETCHAFAFQKSTSSNNNDPASSRDAPPAACTQNISSTLVRPNDMLGTQVVHALPAATNLQLPIKNNATPEPTPEATADLQPYAEDDASKELKTSAEPLIEDSCNSDFGRVDIYWPQSSGLSGCITSPSRQMSGGDRNNLGTLLETSLDAFQNVSIF
uniref:TSL-kinase interacting protein 1 isoform X2 n=1 Tax=Elaeis guineensis var. tenera TaxID=51953 RepID=A0A6I9RND2_ELAGV|nr:TSL-kinase interacting protein 1 isoform X2 [Elaeis guineensis]